MNCPREETWLDFLAGEAANKEQLEKHLEVCDACSTTLDGFRPLVETFAKCSPIEPPARMHGRIIAALRTERATQTSWFERLTSWRVAPWTLALASGLAVLLGFMLGTTPALAPVGQNQPRYIAQVVESPRTEVEQAAQQVVAPKGIVVCAAFGTLARFGAETVDEGEVLETGAIIELAADSIVTLDWRGLGAIGLRGPGRVTLDEVGVHLTAGTVCSTVHPGDEGFFVETPDAMVRVVGTNFQVDANGQSGTDVEVFEGQVGVEDKSSGTQTMLAAGKKMNWRLRKEVTNDQSDTDQSLAAAGQSTAAPGMDDVVTPGASTIEEGF